MKKQDSIINREQFIELVFRQIDMIEDYEALQEILEKVQNKLQMVGNQYSTRKIPSSSTSSKQWQKDEQKRQEHLRRAERENEHYMTREDSVVADYDLWEGEEKDKRRSPSAGRNIEKPSYQLSSFDWVYQQKFNKYILELQKIPFELNKNIFESTQNQSQGTKLVQGSQIHLLIEKYLNDPKENEFLSKEQGQWIDFLVKNVREYCRDYLNLTEMKTEKHIMNHYPKLHLSHSLSNKSCSLEQTSVVNTGAQQQPSQANIQAPSSTSINNANPSNNTCNQPHTPSGNKKVDVIFYNEHRAVIIDWKYSPFGVTDQIYMNDSNHFMDQILEVKKFFNFQKEVSLMIVPLKKLSGCQLIELTSEDIEKLQKEQVNQEIFYQTKYKKMRNSILSKQFNINQKCTIGEGKKHNLTIREYVTFIIDHKKKSQQEYYGNYKSCYGKNPPTNKDQFWALHVLLKEINQKNETILSQVYGLPVTLSQKNIKRGKSNNEEVDFFTMNENHPLSMKKQNSITRHKYRQNKSVLQFVLDQLPEIFFDQEDEEYDYSDDEDDPQEFQIVIQEKDDDEFQEDVPENEEEEENNNHHNNNNNRSNHHDSHIEQEL